MYASNDSLARVGASMIHWSVRHIPNAITIFRIVLVVPTVWMLLQHRFGWALVLFFLAGVSDGLDGYLAKRFGWFSRLGSLLDPIADKLLLVSCYLAVAWIGLLPGWLAVMVLARDVVILTGAVAYYLLLHPFEGQPTWLSKFNTLCQIVLLLAVLWHHQYQSLPSAWLNGLIYLVAGTTIISGIQYIALWGASFLRERRRQTR